MKPEVREYIKHRLARAEDTVREAETLLEAGFSIGVVNRLYYSCFYAVSALLLSEEYSSSKHGGVMALFDQHWIKPKRLPTETSKAITKTYLLLKKMISLNGCMKPSSSLNQSRTG